MNSLGYKYAEQCVSCEHLGLCFKILENAGSITREGEPIIWWACEDIKQRPEEYKEMLRRNGWKEIK
jgi:hypothetical protein